MKINLCKCKSRPRSALVEIIVKIGCKKRGRVKNIILHIKFEIFDAANEGKFDDGILTYGVKFKVGFEPGGKQI